MAPRGLWKGYLKLSLVTCPVSLMPATTESDKLHFHILNRRTGNRVESQAVDSVTGDRVEEDDLVKGYERGEGDYITLEDEELESVALPTVRTIDIETFALGDSIAWIWHDRPHYIFPTDQIGEEAFAVIRDAMAATRRVGIAKLVMYRRERAVKIEPRGKGMVLWTLRYGNEVRDASAIRKSLPKEPVDARALKLLMTLIAERTERWTPGMVDDPVQEKLIDIIAAKRKRRAPRPKEVQATKPEGKVVDIMDALRRSIAGKRSTPRG